MSQLQSSCPTQTTPEASDACREYLAHLKEAELVHLSNKCVYIALWFQSHYPELSIKVGSLGLGTKNIWWEWGGPHYKTVTDFKGLGGRLDGHVWAEDSTGCVYSTIDETMLIIAKHHGKKVGVKSPRLIKGISKTALSASGLNYVEAPASIHNELLQFAYQVAHLHATNNQNNQEYWLNNPPTPSLADMMKEISKLMSSGEGREEREKRGEVTETK